MGPRNSDDKNVRLDNPLGLVFDTPKSDRNLQSSTVFGDRKTRPDDQRKPSTGDSDTGRVSRKDGSVSAQYSHTVPITQVLG